jgi:hypothetical protein
VRVKVGRHWYAGTAAIIDDDDAHARRRQIDNAHGLVGRADGVTSASRQAARSQFGSTWITDKRGSCSNRICSITSELLHIP